MAPACGLALRRSGRGRHIACKHGEETKAQVNTLARQPYLEIEIILLFKSYQGCPVNLN